MLKDNYQHFTIELNRCHDALVDSLLIARDEENDPLKRDILGQLLLVHTTDPTHLISNIENVYQDLYVELDIIHTAHQLIYLLEMNPATHEKNIAQFKNLEEEEYLVLLYQFLYTPGRMISFSYWQTLDNECFPQNDIKIGSLDLTEKAKTLTCITILNYLIKQADTIIQYREENPLEASTHFTYLSYFNQQWLQAQVAKITKIADFKKVARGMPQLQGFILNNSPHTPFSASLIHSPSEQEKNATLAPATSHQNAELPAQRWQDAARERANPWTYHFGISRVWTAPAVSFITPKRFLHLLVAWLNGLLIVDILFNYLIGYQQRWQETQSFFKQPTISALFKLSLKISGTLLKTLGLPIHLLTVLLLTLTSLPFRITRTIWQTLFGQRTQKIGLFFLDCLDMMKDVSLLGFIHYLLLHNMGMQLNNALMLTSYNFLSVGSITLPWLLVPLLITTEVIAVTFSCFALLLSIRCFIHSIKNLFTHQQTASLNCNFSMQNQENSIAPSSQTIADPLSFLVQFNARFNKMQGSPLPLSRLNSKPEDNIKLRR